MRLTDETKFGERTSLLAFLRGPIKRHFAFEEQHVWPRLRAALPPRAAADLGRKVLRARQAVPGNALRIA